MILLSDANILIDFAKVGGLGALVKLGSLEVLDVVLAEVEGLSEPQVTALGVRVVKVQETWLPAATALKKRGLSLADALCLHYCHTSGHTLLSNDGRLRRACAENQVAVHGSLWAVLELHQRAICPSEVLCEWLFRWENELEARLPASELARVRRVLRCTVLL
jgi:predicted nucleic acid-binding protein